MQSGCAILVKFDFESKLEYGLKVLKILALYLLMNSAALASCALQ